MTVVGFYGQDCEQRSPSNFITAFFFFLTGKNQRLGVYNTSSEMDRLSLINHGLRCTGLRIGTLLRNERMFCRKESSIKEAVPQ